MAGNPARAFGCGCDDTPDMVGNPALADMARPECALMLTWLVDLLREVVR